MEKNKFLLTLTIIATILFGCFLLYTLYITYIVAKYFWIGTHLVENNPIFQPFYKSCIEAGKSYGECTSSVISKFTLLFLLLFSISLGLLIYQLKKTKEKENSHTREGTKGN